VWWHGIGREVRADRVPSAAREHFSGVYDTLHTQVTRTTNVGTQDGSLDFLS
jgi:hypothetical protein